jgi:hypothetical protein
LISSDSVQKHLQLTGDQTAQIKEIIDEQQRIYRDFYSSRSVDLPKMRKTIQQHNETMQQSIAQILNEQQLRRLDQIVLQRRGVRAFSDASIAEQLALSEEQLTQIRRIQDESAQHFFGSLAHRWRDDQPSAEDRIKELLNDAQRAKWQELVGPPFIPDMGRRHPFIGYGGFSRGPHPEPSRDRD